MSLSRETYRLDDFIAHIVEAIARIEGYVADMDESGFLASTLVQDAVIRNLEIIGEASNNIGNRLENHPQRSA